MNHSFQNEPYYMPDIITNTNMDHGFMDKMEMIHILNQRNQTLRDRDQWIIYIYG